MLHAKGVRITGAYIKGACQYNTRKVRALAREILNDRDTVMTFVNGPWLPATNNDAERALRHAVIARRICFGTRTDEDSRFYATALTVIETCRKRTVNIWSYAVDLIATARAGLLVPPCPQATAAV